MRYTLVSLLVSTLLLASLSQSTVASEEGGRLPVQGTEIVGDAVWSPDIRVTHNPEYDRLPQVTADEDHNAHIVWYRSGLWTQTIDRTGARLGKEVFITPHVTRGWGDVTRYPLGPGAAIDSRANIHVTWDDGWHDIYYQKFDEFGNALTDKIIVGNDDVTASHTPSIAVDPVNDHVHIVSEDYQYQCEDIVYHKLDNNGKQLVNAVPVSSDVSSHCEHSTLATDDYGNIHVAFGTSTGAWWRKVDQNGVARGISVNLFGWPSYMIADLAITPNGDVHLVWNNQGKVAYTRLDHNGTILNENTTISDSASGAGPPRIAAAHDSNTIFIVWHDVRHGSSDIYYARMEKGSYGVTPENHRLTEAPDTEMYPRVAVDPDDNVHVVWQDFRDGNWEIYYKFMFNYKFKLAPVDVSELAQMRYYHPNETKRQEFYIENQGTLPDGYQVTLSNDPWAWADGWLFHLDETVFPLVEVGERVYFNLTITSPRMARSGDFINISLTATSMNAISVNRTLNWREFVIVERAVSLICGDPSKLIDPGGTVMFDLRLTNTGDAPDTYKLEYSLVPEGLGWEVTLETGTRSLDVGETVPIPLFLQAPEDAMTDVNGSVYVRVFSLSEASVWAAKKLMAFVNPTFHIELATPLVEKWVDPGGKADYPISVTNMGTFHGNVEVYLSSTQTRPGWTAILSNETMFIGGGQVHIMVLTVTAPGDALAGSRQVVKVSAVSEDHSSSGTIEVTVFVNQLHHLDIHLDAVEVSIHAGETARHLMTIHNAGNGNEIVVLESRMPPTGWRVTYELQSLEVTSLPMLARETRTVTLVVTTSFESPAGMQFVHAVLMDGAGTQYSARIGTRIHQSYSLDLSSTRYIARGPPGGGVAFKLHLVNEGNGEDTFSLELKGLPSARWFAGFYDPSGRQVDRIALEAGARVYIDLSLKIPNATGDVDSIEMIASATSTSAERDSVKLTLEVLRPDLRFRAIEYDPQRVPVGERGHIHVFVENMGTFEARDVTVSLVANGKEVDRGGVGTIYPGGHAVITFSWTPTANMNNLIYRVSCDIAEVDYEDNELLHIRSATGGPSDEGLAVWMAIMVLGLVLLSLLWLRAHYTVRIRDDH